MITMIPEYLSARRRNKLSHIAVVVGIVCLTILGMAGNSPAAYADGPGGNVSDPVVRAVDIAKPAVVRIFTLLNAQLIVHFSANTFVTFPQGSNGYPLELSGSGTFITAHGEILTADHVVNPPHADLDSFLQQQAAPDVANYINQVLKANPPVTSDQVASELASGQLPSNSQYSTPQSRVYLSTDYTGPLNVSNFQSIPSNVYAQVDRIEKESSFTNTDVAIIHVSNMNDMAMVQLGDSSSVQQQDELTIIGFPGNGDIAGSSATDILTLSVNKVFVSSMKTTNTGAPVIQVGGNVEHGDSGGPALDKHGNIVGIVSFGPSSGSGSTAFLQASNSARTLVQSLGLDTTPGPFQKAWNQAFVDYASNTPGHWHKAQQEFQQIATNYPQFKAVQPYLDYATAQAKLEKLPQSQTTPQPSSTGSPVQNVLINPLTLIGAGVVLLLALLLFGGIVLQRRSGKQAIVTTNSASPYNTPPPVIQSRPTSPSQSAYRQQPNDSLTAFGAPPSPSMPSNSSGALALWPCGHMNRPFARYCVVCGEPAPPTPPVRQYEQ